MVVARVGSLGSGELVMECAAHFSRVKVRREVGAFKIEILQRLQQSAKM
jgi:hypothetical protein